MPEDRHQPLVESVLRAARLMDCFRRGEPELTSAELELRVAQDHAEQLARRERYLADRDVQEMLDLTNARRRARGLPERTRADYEPAPRDSPPQADQ